MAVTKVVFINDIKIGYTTSAKIKPSLDIKETKTFDGPVIDGNPEPSFDVDIDTLRYDTIDQYTKLTQLLLDMETKGYTIRIWEYAEMKDGKMTRDDLVYECRVSGNEYELKPDERTVEKLSFKGHKRRIWINGKEVKKTV